MRVADERTMRDDFITRLAATRLVLVNMSPALLAALRPYNPPQGRALFFRHHRQLDLDAPEVKLT